MTTATHAEARPPSTSRRNLTTRRTLAAALSLAACAALGACGGDRSAARPADAVEEGSSSMTVQLAWLANVQSAGEYVALEKGFYEDAGLEVELEPGGPNANPIQLVASGATDIGVTYAPPLMLARNENIPVTAFGAAMQRAPLAYFSKESSGITSVEDFEGRKIGVQVGGEPFLQTMLDPVGLTLDDVTVVSVGGDFGPLIADQVDVISGWEINLEQLAALEESGPVNKLRLFENGVQFQSNYYVTREDRIANDAESLARFLEATSQGWRFAIDNPEEAIDIVMAVNPSLDRDKQLEQLTQYLPEYVFGGAAEEHGWGWMDQQMWANTLSEFQEMGEIGDAVTIEQVNTTEVLELASERAGT